MWAETSLTVGFSSKVPVDTNAADPGTHFKNLKSITFETGKALELPFWQANKLSCHCLHTYTNRRH